MAFTAFVLSLAGILTASFASKIKSDRIKNQIEWYKKTVSLIFFELRLVVLFFVILIISELRYQRQRKRAS